MGSKIFKTLWICIVMGFFLLCLTACIDDNRTNNNTNSNISMLNINNTISNDYENNLTNNSIKNDSGANKIVATTKTENKLVTKEENNYSESRKTDSITATKTSNKTVESNYVLNTNTKKFHIPTCSSVKRIKESNRKDYTGTREEIINKGYIPCKNCNP